MTSSTDILPANISLANISQANIPQAKALLYRWLQQQIPAERLAWLDNRLKQLAEKGAADRLLFTTFSSVPRYTTKADLSLTDADLREADSIRAGWLPNGWSLDQAGRTLLLLSLPDKAAESYQASIEKLFSAADVSEQIALYQSLPLLPHPHLFVARAAEGLRTSMTAVFNAIALNNPFPGDHFEQLAWNQMVLKAVFVESPLHLIQQLDRRANPELARMLSDYAHERWAAKREVTPELWRLIGPFLNDQFISDIERALNLPSKEQQLAAAIACAQSSLPAAQKLLSQHPAAKAEIADRQLDWDKFSQQYLAA
ncbi:EboA family metabolite traffic protein [cf. Phormidesmis sp. LEGE 11477]|nr:EboA family metabolite traffic protein [cf. Phormidesmis sp. LEGE 11477]